LVNLTAKEIADILDPNVVTYTEFVEVNAALMQNEERRKYPSIDVQNITGDEQIKDFPTTTLGQTFLVHLFYRYRSFGQEEEPKIKEIEDTIFNTLDDNSNFSTDVKVSITQGWRRTSETFPLKRSHSILTVTTEEISSTDPATEATPGDQIEFLIANFGQFKVISIPSDEIGILKELNLQDTSTQTYTRIRILGSLSVELALSPPQEDNLFALIDAGNNDIVELILNQVTRTLRVNFTNMIASSTREEIRTTILTMDVVEWI
jgi:hypothetical protein